MIQTSEDLCTHVYVTVDDVFQTSIQPYDRRPGPRSSCMDSDILTLTLVAELVGLDDEIVFLNYVARTHYAPRLPERSRSNRRRHTPADVVSVRRPLLVALLTLLPPDERPLLCAR